VSLQKAIYYSQKIIELNEGDSTVEVAFPCLMPWGGVAESSVLVDLSKVGLLSQMTLTEFDTDINPPAKNGRFRMLPPVISPCRPPSYNLADDSCIQQTLSHGV
jgi:hypothetical protein